MADTKPHILIVEDDAMIRSFLRVVLEGEGYDVTEAETGAEMFAALDGGHLAAATLDVFHTEPLPEDHPFWDHPKVTVTPHVASLTVPATAAEAVAENIRRIRAGQAPEPIVDPDAGY